MFGRKKAPAESVQNCSFCGKSQQAVKKLIAAEQALICNECIELCVTLLRGGDDAEAPELAAIEAALTEASVAPAPATRPLARALAWTGSGRAPRILLVGPVGAGKTTLAHALGPAAGRALRCVDLNRITATGYIGEDVENALYDLYVAAGMDLERAQRGVVVFDGLHHVAVGPRDGRLTRDVGAIDVQRHLLRVLGGEASYIVAGPRHPQMATQPIETAGMCVVLTARLDEPLTDPRAIRDALRARGVLGELLARVDLVIPVPRPGIDGMARIVEATLAARGGTMEAADRRALAEAAADHADGAWLVAREVMRRALTG